MGADSYGSRGCDKKATENLWSRQLMPFRMSTGLFDVFTPESAPAWVQAIGSIVAILVAVALPTWQRSATRRDAEKDQKQHELEYLRRFAVALRAEVGCTVEAAGRQRSAANDTLTEIERAHQMGVTITDRGPLPLDSIILTNATIYSAIASEIGRFPSEIIRETVGFYELVRELGRVVSLAPSSAQSAQHISNLAPRAQMQGAIVIRMLEKFEQANFTADAKLSLNQVEIVTLANRYSYPLESVMRERGLIP